LSVRAQRCQFHYFSTTPRNTLSSSPRSWSGHFTWGFPTIILYYQINNEANNFFNEGVGDSGIRIIIWLINNFIPYVPNMNDSNNHVVQQSTSLKTESWLFKNTLSSVQNESDLLRPSLSRVTWIHFTHSHPVPLWYILILPSNNFQDVAIGFYPSSLPKHYSCLLFYNSERTYVTYI
jgi:hypothetical protein